MKKFKNILIFLCVYLVLSKYSWAMEISESKFPCYKNQEFRLLLDTDIWPSIQNADNKSEIEILIKNPTMPPYNICINIYSVFLSTKDGIFTANTTKEGLNNNLTIVLKEKVSGKFVIFLNRGEETIQLKLKSNVNLSLGPERCRKDPEWKNLFFIDVYGEGHFSRGNCPSDNQEFREYRQQFPAY